MSEHMSHLSHLRRGEDRNPECPVCIANARGMTSPVPDPDKEYPPDPVYGFHGRRHWRYTDYDGESLDVALSSEGNLWVQSHGEGPVLVRAEDVALIIRAMTDKEMYARRRRRTDGLELQ